MFDQEFLNRVPSEMKEASARLRKAILRERKARENLDGWRNEHKVASELLVTEEKIYGEVSLRWDPETQTMKGPPEEAPKQT